MLHSKFFRFAIATPTTGLYREFHREFRRGLNTLPRRGFASTQEDRSDGNLEASSAEEIFHTQDKTDDFKEGFKRIGDKMEKRFDDIGKKIDSKFDRLMMIVVGSIVLKGGFDVWRDGRKGSSS
ncbi:hypothetical protein B9Z19DRAFT_1135065 [Tuber borchii]|uniref:Uncharacterized protein n=1 Tax=Tuber borchii TaxID=42251 RepID=A0A2T6ZDE0_TUBBO|nr:hypothetical protein B9Z19DRAFT_1135065 [Tuber borchii]